MLQFYTKEPQTLHMYTLYGTSLPLMVSCLSTMVICSFTVSPICPPLYVFDFLY